MTNCPIPWNKEFDKDKKYIWISETGKNTCEECKNLDRKIFTGDDVPLCPHPNCKCEVKEYQENFQKNHVNNNYQIVNYGLNKVANIKNDDIFSLTLISGAKNFKYNEAANFWKIWYYGFDNPKNEKYIQKNAYVFNTIDSIKNADIERKIYALLPKYIDKNKLRDYFFSIIVSLH